MRQYSQAEPSSPSPQIRSLPPALISALASLDIQLEEELVRYRRLRGGTGQPSRQENRKSAFKPKSLDLISVSATGGRTRPVEAPQQSQSFPSENQPDHQLMPPNTGGNTPGHAVPPHASHLPVFAAGPHNSDLAIAVSTPENQLTAESEAGNSHLAADAEEARGSLVAPMNYRGLDDYLESSEELLRSLAEEEAEVRVERGFMQSLVTPLGIGSMLLLLISSAMFGYVVMNPSSLARLFVPNGSNGSAGNPSDPTGANSSQTALTPPQPNLANEEFKDLNLGTLGTLKDDGSSLPKKTSSSSASPRPSKPTVTSTRLGASGSSTLSPSSNLPSNSTGSTATFAPTRSSAPAPVVPVVPAPPVKLYDPPKPAQTYSAPAAPARAYSSPSAPTSTSKPSTAKSSAPSFPTSTGPSTPTTSGSHPYKVVIPYDSDRTLEAVKQDVPDAYVRTYPDGQARIQTSATNSASEAEARVQELRKQGFSGAEVYKP